MPRTLGFAAAALAQALLTFAVAAPCFAQEDGSKSLFMPSWAPSTMESMTNGLGPLTLFVTFQVAVMTVLALVIAILMRRPVRAAQRAARASAI